MAKVLAPLFSFGASGKLADSIVFFPFKGLNAVRSYVVPANPRSAAQQQQRSYMTDANDEWHDAGYTDIDRSAWNRLATTLGKGLSGFNAFTRSFINESVAGGTWGRMKNGDFDGITSSQFTATLDAASGGPNVHFHYGVSPTFMPNDQVLTDLTGGHWAHDITGLTAGTLYYGYFDFGTPGADYGRTGIYTIRTS